MKEKKPQLRWLYKKHFNIYKCRFLNISWLISNNLDYFCYIITRKIIIQHALSNLKYQATLYGFNCELVTSKQGALIACIIVRLYKTCWYRRSTIIALLLLCITSLPSRYRRKWEQNKHSFISLPLILNIVLSTEYCFTHFT